MKGKPVFPTTYAALKAYGSKGQPVTTDELATLTSLKTEQIASALNHYIGREAEAGRTCDVQRIRPHVYRYAIITESAPEPSRDEPTSEQPTMYEAIGVTSSGHPVVKHPTTGTLYRLEAL